MSAKMSIFRTNRSHITNFDDLEAIEDNSILTSGLCFTFLGVGSNPGWRTSISHLQIILQLKVICQLRRPFQHLMFKIGFY